MKVYQFEYTGMQDTLAVVVLAMLMFVLFVVLGAILYLNIVLTIVLSLSLAFLMFRLLKGKAVRTCTANFNDISVCFEFEKENKTIYFDELTSYKVYYGKNGPILYLNSNVDHFQLFTNSNFCKTDGFILFCEDLLKTLDAFKNTRKPGLIRNHSIFATKSMLYFLILATVIYLGSFLIETNKQKIVIGIVGGFYFLLMWTKYFWERKKPNKTA